MMRRNNDILPKEKQLALKFALESEGISCTLMNENYIFIEDEEEHRSTIRKLCRQHGINSFMKVVRNGKNVLRIHVQSKGKHCVGKIKCLNCGAELRMVYSACPECKSHLSAGKISFLAYLGPSDNLAGYQRSYKLVFLKSIFEECLAGENTPKVRAVVERFKNYYVKRKHAGLVVDKNVDSRIANIEESSLEDVFEVIKANPYEAIRTQGFISIDELNGAFVLRRGIHDLSNIEIKNILNLLQEKLELYYEKIGSKALADEAGDTVPVKETEVVTDVAPSNDLLISDEEVALLHTDATISTEQLATPYTLEGLGLSNRTYNVLRRNGVCTTREMIEAVLSGKICELKYVGAQTVIELENVVDSLRNGTYINNMALRVDPVTELQDQKAVSDYVDSADHAFEVIHESNLRFSVSTLRFFGYTQQTIRTIREAGITTFSDLKEAGYEAIVKLVGKQKSLELREILKSFEAPLCEIGAEIFRECSKDRKFEIYQQRSKGDSLQVVADNFGLTRERIRQICLKFERRLRPVVQMIAEAILASNDFAYFAEEQIFDVFDGDNYETVILAVLKSCPEYTYLDFAKTFVLNSEYPDAEREIEKIAEDIVGDGINLFEKLEAIEEVFANSGYGFVNADIFLNLLIKHNYKFYGDYVIRTRKSYGLLCAEIIADEFPNGIHTSNDEEIARLRRALEAKYGKLDVPENNRSFITRVVSFLVQAGRSIYIAPKNIVIDDELLLDIKAYIDKLTYQDVYYNQLFAEYEGILMMTSNVDNPGFLHGVLAWRFPDDYTYGRDFLRKPDAVETASLAEQIRNILVEAGTPLAKKQILNYFHGLTDAMFNNAFYSVPWLIQWEYGIYNCSDNLKVVADDVSRLRELLESLLESNDGYCSQELLYKRVIRELPTICEVNRVHSAQNIFYIAAYFLGEDFCFNRPHIATKGRFAELDVKTIALELLGCPDVLDAEEFFSLAKRFEWSEVTANLVFSNIEKEYIRLDKNTYQKAKTFKISKQDLEHVAELLSMVASNDWYLPLQRFTDNKEYALSGIHVNEFIIGSLVRRYDLGWKVVSPQAKNRRYEKGILVKDNLDINAYDQLVAKVLDDAGVRSLTTTQLLSFLQIHKLTFATIPKELEASEYFVVSDDQFTLA